MRRGVLALLSSIVVAASCVVAPAPSDPPGPSEPPAASLSPSALPRPRPSAAIATSVPPSEVASLEPTDEPQPTLAPFPTDAAATDLPAAIGGIAWGALRYEPAAEARTAQLLGGMLGSGPTIDVELADPLGYPNPVVAGSLVAVPVRSDRGHMRVRAWHGTDGSPAIDLDVVGVDATVTLDPDRDLLYIAAAQAAGGVEIRRRSFDGVIDDLLIRLDKRFTPDAIPTERYGLTVDPDGVLVVEACGDADGCRLWEIPPGIATAPKPRTLPGHPPGVCRVIGATREWLVVSDDDACWADTGGAPLPVRAIHRADGVSHLVTDDHASIGRIVEVDGRTVLVGTDDFVMGATVDIVRYDVVTGRKAVLVRDIPPGADDQTTSVAPTVLPGTWVLLLPALVDAAGLPTSSAHLLDVSSGATVELPVGTFGWF